MDGLAKAFADFETKNPDADYQSFQAGFTASAVSMRSRAMAAIDAAHMPDQVKNKLKDAIGSLPDIPA